MLGPREAKEALFVQFARISRALDSPKRIELLELLAQGERSVKALASLAGLGVTNASAHLQGLLQARLVATRKEGTRVLYRLADDQVARFLIELRALAHARLAEVDQVVRTYVSADGDPTPVTQDELQAQLRRGSVVVVDVRPFEEYAAGHIAGAISMPLDVLESEMARLPQDVEIVAYCRGPYCLLAPLAVRSLCQKGFRARRFATGFPEWRLAGLPVKKAS